MKQVVFEHVFECDADTYWDKVFFDEDYNRRLFLETLKFTQWQQTIGQKTDDRITRTVLVRPPVGDVPGAIKKILGEKFGYTEHGTFDRKTRRYRIDIEPSVSADKAKITGELWVEPAGDKRIKRIAKMSVEVNVMLVGKLIEDKVIGDMRPSYERAAEFTNQWVREKGL